MNNNQMSLCDDLIIGFGRSPLDGFELYKISEKLITSKKLIQLLKDKSKLNQYLRILKIEKIRCNSSKKIDIVRINFLSFISNNYNTITIL